MKKMKKMKRLKVKKVTVRMVCGLLHHLGPKRTRRRSRRSGLALQQNGRVSPLGRALLITHLPTVDSSDQSKRILPQGSIASLSIHKEPGLSDLLQKTFTTTSKTSSLIMILTDP
jgi:hypothetical protein